MVSAAKKVGRHGLRDSTAECSGRRTAGFKIPLAYRSNFDGVSSWLESIGAGSFKMGTD